jgi:aminopeptidase N
MMPCNVPLFACCIVAAMPLAAQSNKDRVSHGAYVRSHDYDLVHQRIELWDFDWDSTAFKGRVTTTLIALRPGLDSIILDAGKLLTIRRVTAASGTSLRFATHGDTLVVYPAKPVAFHDTTRFAIEYRGRVDNRRGLNFIPATGEPHRPQQIWSQGEDINNHYWFPTYDFPNDRMTWSLRATVPAQYAVVSNGRLVLDRKNASGTRTVEWSQDLPSSTYLVSLIVAPLTRLTDSWRGIPVDYYVYREDTALARRLFRVTPDMIDVYSRLTGIKYPWAKYAQTTVADFFGGMENVSATTLVDWLPDARAYQDRPWYQWILIPHELAHQWFGDYVTTVDWANMWLNEGFAEFMPGQYWRVKLGAHAEEDYFLDEYTHFMEIDRRRRMPLAALASNNIYPKGALVLRMLERYLGAERFWASIHAFLTRHALENATTDDLRQAVLHATGENLDWFWDEWIYQAGYPQFTVAAAYDTAASKLTLTVIQTQDDSGAADSTGLRFTTPAVFRMPVTIRVGTAAADVVQRVTLQAREQTIDFAGLTTPPTMVVFDDGNTVLKSLTFEQPTAWLATQLRRDSDLWNRLWVIQQLATRGSDAVAAAALAEAAMGGDYFRTRAHAVEALGGFPPAVALPVLESALRDTSAAVRQSAVAALGEIGGDRAIALAHTAFTADPSYQVRAAAVAALASADPANQRTVIAQALALPSYQDAIATAALRAIAQSNDTSFIDQVEGLLGQFRVPAHVLGALANRGSARALDVLTHHLDDERPHVRRWVLQAFQSTVQRELAIGRLRAVEGSLRYPDTKRAAARLRQRLEERERNPGA